MEILSEKTIFLTFKVFPFQFMNSCWIILCNKPMLFTILKKTLNLSITSDYLNSFTIRHSIFDLTFIRKMKLFDFSKDYISMFKLTNKLGTIFISQNSMAMWFAVLNVTKIFITIFKLYLTSFRFILNFLFYLVQVVFRVWTINWSIGFFIF